MENVSQNAMHQHRHEGDEYRRIEVITGVVRRQAHLIMPGRVNSERSHQQTLRQTPADAADKAAVLTPAASDSDMRAGQHSPIAVRTVVPGLANDNSPAARQAAAA
jgi:hypothetical protein